MSQAEKDEALAFLKRPDLVTALLDDGYSIGFVGEEKSKLLAYLIGLSRKLEHPLSGVVMSQSGAGKSSLAEMVEQLTPPEDVVLYSRISAQALGYLPTDFLKRKLLILEERVGAEAASYQIRILQSRQRLSQAIVVKDPVSGKMQTKHFEVEGPIAYLETTTESRINHENATRCFELTLDESEVQTQRIQERQREGRSTEGLQRRNEVDAIRARHHNAQRLLEPVRVLIPYVHHLTFPTRWLRTRRDNERFLCLIEAAAFLHQHQRQRGVLGEGDKQVHYIEATVEDYKLAYELARQVLGITLHELTRHAQELWVLAQAMVTAAKSATRQDVLFTRRELRQATGWEDHRLRGALEELCEMEYVVVLNGTQGKTYRYRLAMSAAEGPTTLSQLTTPEELAARLRQSA